MKWVSLLATLGLLSGKGAAMQRADDQYNSGPETLVRQSNAIVTGPASHFSKRVLESHAPSGTPLRWEVSGELDHPKVLKGKPSLPVKFTRREHSPVLEQQDGEYWESPYMQWEPGDTAVICFRDAAGREGTRVYSSGSGNRDLASIVEHIVKIEAKPDSAQRFAAWSEAAKSATTMTERQAALRSLLAFRKPWDEISLAVRTAMERPDMREFTFALTAYGIRTGQWPDALPAAEFLCEQLEKEKDNDRVSSYLASFGVLLNFANQEDH